jgi:hypothetical protein
VHEALGIIMARLQLIQKLLRTLHLNVPERRRLDPPAIDFVELLAVVEQLVERDACFSSGELTLEKLANDHYRVHRLVPDPEAGDMWAELGVVPVTDEYTSKDAATRAFLRQLIGPGWRVPVSTIDGIKILGCPAD